MRNLLDIVTDFKKELRRKHSKISGSVHTKFDRNNYNFTTMKTVTTGLQTHISKLKRVVNSQYWFFLEKYGAYRIHIFQELCYVYG